jgi:hypothetical protein
LLYSSFVLSENTGIQVKYDRAKVDSVFRIVEDPNSNYKEQDEIIYSNDAVRLDEEYLDFFIEVYKKLLEQSKEESDSKGIFYSYDVISGLYFNLWNKHEAQVYIDSASQYLSLINDEKELLASYYRIYAQFIQRFIPSQNIRAIEYYHKALDLYDEIGLAGHEFSTMLVLSNLTMDAIQRGDSVYIMKNLERMEKLRDNSDFPIMKFAVYDIYVLLYKAKYKKYDDLIFLDSCIYYSRKCLEMYEKDELPHPFYFEAVNFYVDIAESLILKKDYKPQTIDSLLTIAGNACNQNDSIAKARVLQVRARMLNDLGRTNEALSVVLEAQDYLKAEYKKDYYYLVKKNIDILRDIYYSKGDYKKVIEYNDLWMQVDEEVRANEVKELELQIDVNAKDLELKHLLMDRNFRETQFKMVFIICILLVMSVFSFFLFIRSKRRSLYNEIALIKSEKEEANLNLKLKEEQAVKAELEKYEVLSDFYLKEMELVGKSRDLEQLYKDKEELDKQVELYRQKLESYEASHSNISQSGAEIKDVISEEIKTQIAGLLSNNDDYIRNLNLMNPSFIDSLRQLSDGNLSVSYLKYCICFAIGMEIIEVAECFNIEQSSVHMIRYRLKKKFGLGNDDDLYVFLQKYYG